MLIADFRVKTNLIRTVVRFEIIAQREGLSQNKLKKDGPVLT